MKRRFILLTVICLGCNYTFAQRSDTTNNKKDKLDEFMESKETGYSEKHPESYKTESGLIFHVGDYITFGKGTMPGGDFKYITVNSTSFFRAMSASNHINNDQNSLSRDWSGYKEKIIRFDRTGSRRGGYKTVAIISANGAIRYMVDLNAAIETGEIVVPQEFRPKNNNATVIQQQLSTADEIAKYKKLLDEGVITKEEFEAQKQKLLAK